MSEAGAVEQALRAALDETMAGKYELKIDGPHMVFKAGRFECSVMAAMSVVAAVNTGRAIGRMAADAAVLNDQNAAVWP